jgi:hypothetical protein
MNVPAPFPPFAPHWSAEELADAVPRALPPLHRFAFVAPANAAALHRPRRQLPAYVDTSAPTLFRVRG